MLAQLRKTLFRDHEIYIRTGQDVHFLRVSARLQQRIAIIVGSILGLWLIATLYMLGARLVDDWQDNRTAARAQSIARAEARLDASRDAIARQVESLQQRQNFVEGVVREMQYEEMQPAPQATPHPAAATRSPAQGDEISALNRIGTRQATLVAQLTIAADRRATEAEAALRTTGINTMLNGGRGGPFTPTSETLTHAPRDPAFQQLARAFDRMQQLEQIVRSIPTTLPATGMNLSSGFGFRHDPFNGSAAMHAGLDFVGAYGSPVKAAADGRVAFVGTRSGYGNVVEIDHGHGILTRYAHLSGFTARLGQSVQAGEQVARMGSTGRSTGTHLHFEVRIDGNAVNPRRFLEANPGILEIQTRIGKRPHDGAAQSD